jgi:NADH-quinone oxidoreductase subunit K
MGIFSVGLNHFLGLGAILFGLGLYGIITRKNAISWLIGIELMLSAIIIILIAFSRYQDSGTEGQAAPVFIIIIGSIQVAGAAAIALLYYKNNPKENIIN